jgi:hypothetical protein
VWKVLCDRRRQVVQREVSRPLQLPEDSRQDGVHVVVKGGQAASKGLSLQSRRSGAVEKGGGIPAHRRLSSSASSACNSNTLVLYTRHDMTPISDQASKTLIGCQESLQRRIRTSQPTKPHATHRVIHLLAADSTLEIQGIGNYLRAEQPEPQPQSICRNPRQVHLHVDGHRRRCPSNGQSWPTI